MRETFKRCLRPSLLGALTLALLHGCGSPDESTVAPAPADFSFGFTIGTQGGVVNGNGITLEIPPGALEETIEITVRDTLNVPVPEGLIMVGRAFDLDPDGTEFAQPVVVRLDLSTASLVTGSPELYQSSDGQTFELVADSAFDPAFKLLTGTIRHFSFVAAFGTSSDFGRGGTAAGGTGGTSAGVAGSGGNGGDGGGGVAGGGAGGTSSGGGVAGGGAGGTSGNGGTSGGAQAGGGAGGS